jgi:putative flippase GtrA
VVPIIIPVYKPGHTLPSLVKRLISLTLDPIIIVDDGSGSDFAIYFEEAAQSDRVHLVRHAVNLGKGAALRTGMNFALVNFPGSTGVVTADADGQHAAEDISRVAKRLLGSRGALVMGVRTFASDVPLRSRIGNNLTCLLMRLLIGQRLADTQTGLRGVPVSLIHHLLRLQSLRYEFELDMLIACKHQGTMIVEEPIRTIYLQNNKSSHFDPIFDSMRIYFLLFRFSILALLTATLDNIVFAAVFKATKDIAQSQIAARLVAMTFNYMGARTAVFQSRQRHAIVLPKYVSLVVINGLLSYLLIQWIIGRLAVGTIAAKLIAEGVLFMANFAIQRDFVFSRRKSSGGATDWDTYYTSVTPTAKLTRKYTRALLLDAIRQYAAPVAAGGRFSIVEIGGANSCFVDRILSETGCARYDVVDTNHYGLELLQNRVANNGIVHLHELNVLGLKMDRTADVVFSVGLVEHFDPPRTREAVLAHFDVLRPGGTAIITFPTPTLLYRATRCLIEMIGMWKFPDERPLEPAEVIAAVRDRADVLMQKTLWPLMLTQHMIVARKHQ